MQHVNINFEKVKSTLTRKSYVIFSFLLLSFFSLEAQDRCSSYPYVSGDTFRSFCDYIFDETGCNLIPEEVKEGETIFLKTDYLEKFFLEFHPRIASPYILVTHNSDYAVPGRLARFLDTPKLIAWFGQNVEGCVHPKLYSIPIGLANRYWRHGNIEAVLEAQKRAEVDIRSDLLYLNVKVANYPSERTYVFHKFSVLPYCKTSGQVSFSTYLNDLAKVHFVLSPRGNGVDCHRTWEALYMGAIPIVKSTQLDPMFEGLPVLIVNNWDEVTFDYLQSKLAEMEENKIPRDKMYADYWFDLITSLKP